MTRDLQAPDAVSAARRWLEANKLLFKLDSTDSLAAVTTEPLVGTTNDYAVVFRQQADGVASTDAVATVALVGSMDAGWDVVYASSSLTGGSTDATGGVELAPAEAWTQAASGKTFHLAKGGSATLRLSNRWRWSEPKASTRAVVLTPVEYFVDPGFREWTIDARRAGSATIQSVGGPNCSTCALVTRSFRVTVVVAAG